MLKKIKENKIYFLGLLIFIIGTVLFTVFNFNKYFKEYKTEIRIEEYIDNSSKVMVDESETQEEKKGESKVDYDSYNMVIEIPSINLKYGLYDINSRYNSVYYGLQILRESDMPDITNGNLIIAGHSGNSSISFFRNLHYLELDQDVYIYYNGIKYTYKIVNRYEEEKTGTITIHRNSNKTIIGLITCKSRSNSQYVYIGELINKEVY